MGVAWGRSAVSAWPAMVSGSPTMEKRGGGSCRDGARRREGGGNGEVGCWASHDDGGMGIRFRIRVRLRR